jgi:hypothetical protein
MGRNPSVRGFRRDED